MNSKYLIKNIISSIFLKIVSFLYGFIIPVLIIRKYGSETNGLVSSITQFLAYIVLLEGGLGPVIKNALYEPLVKKNKSKINDILGTSDKFFKKIAIIFFAYVLIICVVYPFFVQGDYTNFYIISLILCISISRFAEYFVCMTYKMFLQADGKNYVIDYVYIITYIIDIFVIVNLINNNFSIQMLKLACSLIYLLRPLIIKWYFDKNYTYRINKSSNYNLPKKWDALFHHIAATVQDNVDIIVLTMFNTLKNVSVYSIYFLVTSGIRSIICSLLSGFDAFFGKMMVEEKENSLCKKFTIYNFTFYTISTIILSDTMILIIPFIKIYTQNISDINYIYPLFGYLMVFAEFVFIIRYPFSTLTFAKGHFKETKMFSIIEPIVNIILSIILVSNYGLIGVAIGTILSLTIRSIGFIIYGTKKILKQNLFKICSIIMLSFFELLAVFIINIKFINIIVSNYLQWFLIGMVSTFIISIIIILINSILYKSIFIETLNIFKSKIRRKKHV